LALSEAAAQLGLTGEALRKRIRRGQACGRRDNHGRWLVLVQDGLEPVHSERPSPVPDGGLEHTRTALERTRTELALALDRLERAEAEAADRDRRLNGLQAERDELRAELVRERNRAEDMRAEAAELRGRLAEATRPGPIGRLLEALVSRLMRGTDVQRS
jgi:hypothetical protein